MCAYVCVLLAVSERIMLVRAADVRASRVKADYAGDRVKQTIDVADDSQAGELFADGR